MDLEIIQFAYGNGNMKYELSLKDVCPRSWFAPGVGLPKELVCPRSWFAQRVGLPNVRFMYTNMLGSYLFILKWKDNSQLLG